VCTLALFLRQSDALPLVIAANRDELLARPSAGPTAVADDPWIVAGIDLEAGGTWLGVNARGLAVGILNRRTALGVDPTLRSRGALAMEVLGCESVEEARALVRARPAPAYNPFNLLVASPEAAFVAQNWDEAMRLTELPPGLHLLTNLDLNDPTCPRIAKSHQLFEAARAHLDAPEPDALVAHLRRVLSDHSTPLDPRGGIAPGPIANLCVHFGTYGTRSSSILLYERERRRWRYFHATGAPCTCDYGEVALPGGGAAGF
jgi:uncharacterized protein with NRDE domain